MKKASKKIVSLLLCALLLAMVAPMGAVSVAAETEGIYYDISGGEAILAGCVDPVAGDVVIPATVQGCPVTAIADHAFYEFRDLTSVTIPDSVIEIGSSAFYGCESLTTVVIPDSVKEIGEHAFANCTNLTKVTISSNVKVVDDYWFAGCKNLTSVIIPDGVHEIGYRTFADCKNLTSVTIPKSVIDIGAETFDGCISLTDVYYGGTEADFEEVYVGDTNYYLLDATWHYNAEEVDSADDTTDENTTGDDTSNGPWLWVGIGGGTLIIGTGVIFLLKKKKIVP